MSATIDEGVFASLFPDTRLLRFSGRAFEVKVFYWESRDANLEEEAVELVTYMGKWGYLGAGKRPNQDIIVFLTGVEEIGNIAKCLKR